MHFIPHPYKPGRLWECYDDETSPASNHVSSNHMSELIEQQPEPSSASDVNAEVGKLDIAITAALDAAKAGGLPQGFIVAVLHAHDLKQTQMLLG